MHLCLFLLSLFLSFFSFFFFFFFFFYSFLCFNCSYLHSFTFHSFLYILTSKMNKLNLNHYKNPFWNVKYKAQTIKFSRDRVQIITYQATGVNLERPKLWGPIYGILVGDIFCPSHVYFFYGILSFIRCQNQIQHNKFRLKKPKK